MLPHAMPCPKSFHVSFSNLRLEHIVEIVEQETGQRRFQEAIIINMNEKKISWNYVKFYNNIFEDFSNIFSQIPLVAVLPPNSPSVYQCLKINPIHVGRDKKCILCTVLT